MAAQATSKFRDNLTFYGTAEERFGAHKCAKQITAIFEAMALQLKMKYSLRIKIKNNLVIVSLCPDSVISRELLPIVKQAEEEILELAKQMTGYQSGYNFVYSYEYKQSIR